MEIEALTSLGEDGFTSKIVDPVLKRVSYVLPYSVSLGQTQHTSTCPTCGTELYYMHQSVNLECQNHASYIRVSRLFHPMSWHSRRQRQSPFPFAEERVQHLSSPDWPTGWFPDETNHKPSVASFLGRSHQLVVCKHRGRRPGRSCHVMGVR